MTKLQWPVATVILAAIVAIVVLAVLDADTGDLMTIILIVLGGMGFTQLNAIREQTNGTNTEQLRMIRDLSEKVAAMSPAPLPPIHATAEVQKVETTVTMAPPAGPDGLVVPLTRNPP